MRDVMLSQDCLYTLVERNLEGDQARIIGSIVNFLNAASAFIYLQRHGHWRVSGICS
jgi:hypothetical protein